jgi:hypothetical protein
VTVAQQGSGPLRWLPSAPKTSTSRRRRLGATPHLLALAGVAALLRVPFLGSALTPDEAGFSLVARQWGPGTELYGKYWVDRPPLLLELFRLASHVGTPVGLRLLGCLAAATATLSVGACARSLIGPHAGFWAAAVAAIGLSSPAIGAVPVNGELLAAPFVATSLLCWVESRRRQGDVHVGLLVMSGAAASAAVLVKQNMIDAVLFFVVATALDTFRPARKRVGVVVPAVAWAGGALAAILAVLGLAVSRGSSVTGIWYAMYPFRLAAAHTIQGYSASAHVHALLRLGSLELLTLGPLLFLATVVVVLRHRRDPSLDVRVVGPALLVVGAYDAFSIIAGGSYWTHYLVQLVVPTALVAGIVASRRFPLGEALTALVVGVSLVVAVLGWRAVPTDTAGSTGRAIAAVSQPGDSIVSTFGDADIVRASGLRSDYAYLWSLPARTLDKNFVSLATLLEGPDAPTWVVVRGTGTRSTLLHAATGAPLRDRYHETGRVCGRMIFERDDANRPVPTNPAECSSS